MTCAIDDNAKMAGKGRYTIDDYEKMAGKGRYAIDDYAKDGGQGEVRNRRLRKRWRAQANELQ